MSSGQRLAVLTIAFAFGNWAMAAPPPPPWQTCSLTEGKEDGCGPGDRPRPFHEFLLPGAWANVPGDSFSGAFEAALGQPQQFDATWREIGRWGSHSIRSVRYLKAGSLFASIILAEGNRNVFAPLIKWSGGMPDPVLYEQDGFKVLVLQKDFGVNIPMVSTWAWIWGVKGPFLLNVSAAMAEAIEKVAPGYSGYDTALDWPKLHCQTWVWKGKYPGKVGVGNTVEAWFELAPEGFLLKRANFGRAFDDEPRTNRWPRTGPVLASAEQRPSRSAVSIELKDLRGIPVSVAEVRFQGGASTSTDSRGAASAPLPSALPEGSPALLEIVDSPRSLVILSPCRGVIPVSPSTHAIVLAPKGDRAILASPVALEALADCLLRTSPPLERYAGTQYPRYRRQALESLAQSIMVKPAALDAAIRTWGGKANDSFARGLVALYEERPGPAAAHFRTAIPTLVEPAKLARAEFYLGRALYAQRRFAQATAHYSRSATLGEADSALLTSRAFALWDLQDYTAATQQLRRVLSIEERLFGPNAKSVAVAARNLANVLYYKPESGERETLYQRARAIAEQTAGLEGGQGPERSLKGSEIRPLLSPLPANPQSADYAEALHDLGDLADTRLDSPSAKDLFTSALNIRRKLLGASDRETAETINRFGTLLYRQRRSCPEALPYFRKTLAIWKQAFGPNHPNTALAINAIAFCFEETGALDLAESHYRQAASILESTVGDDDPLLLADILGNLAYLLGTRHRPQEAAPLHLRAISIQREILGPDHPALIGTLHGMALSLAENGQLRDAEPPLRRAAALREAASGPSHSALADILGDLAAVLVNQSKLAEAEPLLRRTLDIQARTLPPIHQNTAKTLSDLAILLDRKGQPEQALALCERSLAMYRTALGPQSQQARSAEQLLNDLRKKRNQ